MTELLILKIRTSGSENLGNLFMLPQLVSNKASLAVLSDCLYTMEYLILFKGHVLYPKLQSSVVFCFAFVVLSGFHLCLCFSS